MVVSKTSQCAALSLTLLLAKKELLHSTFSVADIFQLLGGFADLCKPAVELAIKSLLKLNYIRNDFSTSAYSFTSKGSSWFLSLTLTGFLILLPRS